MDRLPDPQRRHHPDARDDNARGCLVRVGAGKLHEGLGAGLRATVESDELARADGVVPPRRAPPQLPLESQPAGLRNGCVQPQRDFDVVVIGGSLAGAATATLLLRQKPDLRVAIVEKSITFGRRVGEATVEISGYFLSRVLGLMSYLNETQITKHGMRFWFANPRTHSLPECSEIGGRYLSRVPAWQVDRSTLDEEVLRRVRAAGATVFRPAKVRSVRLNAGESRNWRSKLRINP